MSLLTLNSHSFVWYRAGKGRTEQRTGEEGRERTGQERKRRYRRGGEKREKVERRGEVRRGEEGQQS